MLQSTYNIFVCEGVRLMKKIVSFLLVLSMIWSISATAFAQQKQDPNNIVGHYVEELVIMSDEELASLSLVEASLLFEKAFHVSSNSYSEDEIRIIYWFSFDKI